MMEAARISETSVNFYQTTRWYNPEDSNPHNLYFEYCKGNEFNVMLLGLCIYKSIIGYYGKLVYKLAKVTKGRVRVNVV
jgi:hypothetical protein